MQKILIAKEVSSVASMAAKRTVLILVGNISSSSLYSQDDKLGHISDQFDLVGVSYIFKTSKKIFKIFLFINQFSFDC